jgi:5-methylthioadenosine/S-adenosylhomocysteine deaminase
LGSFRLAAEAVVCCDEAATIHQPGAVEVEEGRLVSVGPAEPGEPRRPGVLMPGLVNCHCHSPMTLFRGAAEDMPLQRFLREVLWPREARLMRDDVYWGMTLACAELLRFGVTTTCEMYVHEDGILDAVESAGTRCVLTPGVIDVPGWLRWEERLDEVVAFCDRVSASSPDRVRVGIAAHSAYALPLEALDALVAAAQERELLVHFHLAETEDECAALEAEHGKSVPALLSERGFFDGRVLAAHAVWLDDGDLRTLAEHDVAVAHCPQSNAKLGAGVARLADMLQAGLRVGLGTDGPSSNNDLDLWEEMRLAALLARAGARDAGVLPAAEALALATRTGAAALGLDEVGVLEPGRTADMILVRTDDAAFVPVVEERDLLSHLAWSASSRLVSAVWVSGRQVVRDGACVTVDEERARREVQTRAMRLASAA